MHLTRRQWISTALAAAITPRWVHAQVTMGGISIDSLSDGHLTLPAEFLIGPMPATAVDILRRYGLGPATLTPPCNITLVRDGTRVVLIDCGAGPSFQASTGALPAALETLGLAPSDITHVILTHGHPDHLWGILDDFDEPMFPEAEHMMGQAEWAYWTDPATVGTIVPARQSFAVGAARRLAAIGDITLFDDGAVLVPGVTAVSTPGHTPGHMAVSVTSGNDGLMIIGDAISNHHIAFEHPDWPSGNDEDREAGAQARLSLLDRLASDSMPLLGFHLPQGGIGRVERVGDSYKFHPGL